MRPLRWTTPFVLSGLIGACATVGGGATKTTPDKPMVATTRPTPWTLVYADGSANVYRLSQANAGEAVRFEYDPVTPEQSSTGHYSGGDPKQAQIPSDDPRVEELWRRVDALEATPSLHTQERAKRTGRFTLTTPAGTRDFIVQFCPSLSELDQLLLGFRR